MKAIVLNDIYVGSIAKTIIVLPNKKSSTIEMIFSEDGKQDLRMNLSIDNARELNEFITKSLHEIVLPKTPKLPKI